MSLKVKENGKWVSIGKVKYTIAKDSDFSGPANSSSTRYIGESTNIVMPLGIGGVDFLSYNSMFKNSSYKKLAIISINNNLQNMDSMFSSCKGLTELDLTNFDTSKVTNMDSTFDGCSGLTELDLTNFDTSKVTNMYSMFGGCSGLTELNLSSFDTSNVTGMYSMFYGCSGLTELDLTNFDTSKVTNMGGMFSGCSNLTELNLSSFDTSKVTSMGYMFNGCSKLKKVYVRTEADATKFRNSGGFPSGATVIVK